VAYNQYPQYPPPGYGGGYQQPRQTSGECVAGMVLGIVAVVVSLFPFAGLIGVIGLILSIVGMRKARRQGRSGYGMGVAGLVCSIVALIPTAFVLIFFFSVAASCVGSAAC
jgi:membrane-bound ClpP family serine protease